MCWLGARRMQRAGWVLAGTEVPNAADMASLNHLVSLLQRHVSPSEVKEVRPEQIRSARDVAGLVRWRVGRWLRTLRTRRQLAYVTRLSVPPS